MCYRLVQSKQWFMLYNYAGVNVFLIHSCNYQINFLHAAKAIHRVILTCTQKRLYVVTTKITFIKENKQIARVQAAQKVHRHRSQSSWSGFGWSNFRSEIGILS